MSKTRTILSILAWGLAASAAQAQAPAPAAAAASAPRHPWQAALPGLTAEAYFTNMEPGMKIETPFVAKFGLSGGWGLAPITQPVQGKGGHHHLLVNRELPLDFKQPLPFNDQYIHFGKGQMETVLTLPPGSYKLRLLLADDKHLPYFVYSKPLNVTVTKKNAGIDPQSLTKKGISLLNLADNAKLKPPFRVQFHASGLNVAHVSQQEKETGHFRLSLHPKGAAKPVELDFTEGQTEVWLAPPRGDYTLRLELLDNVNPGKALAEAVSVPILVE
ncbi:DUF4399 domain-containing protein [Variovorax terrae]|uniref:DUF4399 domain-containing protein n=1 Tax=Variovorax terrae TaxID=2923278 RepID=A0A9X1VXQ8_9BURK|nr:DUF4399 domain-containing protein [Variovorax terrae]MCJ0762473.1 DUF4399 domain-containing protein [Variovorax terrae]